MSISEKICYSTVRIECIQDNNTRSTGTGFFFDFSMDKGSCIPCIVTNKHVVEKASKEVKKKTLAVLKDVEKKLEG